MLFHGATLVSFLFMALALPRGPSPTAKPDIQNAALRPYEKLELGFAKRDEIPPINEIPADANSRFYQYYTWQQPVGRNPSWIYNNPAWFGTTTKQTVQNGQPTQVPRPQGIKVEKDDSGNINIAFSPAIWGKLTGIAKNMEASCAAAKKVRRQGLGHCIVEALESLPDALAEAAGEDAGALREAGQVISIATEEQLAAAGVDVAGTVTAATGAAGVVGSSISLIHYLFEIAKAGQPLPQIVEAPKDSLSKHRKPKPEDEDDELRKQCPVQTFEEDISFASTIPIWVAALKRADPKPGNAPTAECDRDQNHREGFEPNLFHAMAKFYCTRVELDNMAKEVSADISPQDVFWRHRKDWKVNFDWKRGEGDCMVRCNDLVAKFLDNSVCNVNSHLMSRTGKITSNCGTLSYTIKNPSPKPDTPSQDPNNSNNPQAQGKFTCFNTQGSKGKKWGQTVWAARSYDGVDFFKPDGQKDGKGIIGIQLEWGDDRLCPSGKTVDDSVKAMNESEDHGERECNAWLRATLDSYCPLAIVGHGSPEQDRGFNGLNRTFLLPANQVEIAAPGKDGNIATVLPCGHIFCRACVFRIRFQGYIGPGPMLNVITPNFDTSNPRCPVCRATLRYKKCWANCTASGIPFPKSADALARFPQTTPEAASSGKQAMPENCNTCLLTKERVETERRFRQRLWRGWPELLESNRMSGWVIGISITESLLWSFYVKEKTLERRLEETWQNVGRHMNSRPWGGAPSRPGLRFTIEWGPTVQSAYNNSSALNESEAKDLRIHHLIIHGLPTREMLGRTHTPNLPEHPFLQTHPFTQWHENEYAEDENEEDEDEEDEDEEDEE
ncbi:hypothetical protein CPLU01_13844 [Colletotrichum plurivorum]|uniref:RING-type domain-containing protein n=1 Tax=Colletotrichum plurivorum TaxID=2175906 RepID=A0A8H6JNG8_9PEZI|nr:hypothetical protein CPLU01_13844 [Colletotrichum plurivorum]